MVPSYIIRTALLSALILPLCLNDVLSQVVTPGGGINWYTEVPGLTNELQLTITNITDGGSTGTSDGEVNKLDSKNYQIRFPYTMVDAVSNNIIGSFTIHPSGTTTVTYLPGFSFTNLPNVTFTFRDTNMNLVATPVITDLNTTNCTVKFVTTGGVITNAWNVDYRANYGLSYCVAGTIGTIGGMLDGTNVFRRDGSYPLTGNLDAGNHSITNIYSLQIGGGALANSWLAGDASGNASWQSRLAANLNDYSALYLVNGTRTMTGHMNLGTYNIYNVAAMTAASGFLTRLYLGYPLGPGPAPSGYKMVLAHSASGEATWQLVQEASRWWANTAAGAVTIGGNHLTGVNTLGAVTAVIGAGGISSSGPTTFSSASANVFSGTGGSYASPVLRIAGVTRNQALAYYDYGLVSQQGNPAYYNVSFYAGNSSHICAEGDILAGDAAWMAATVPDIGAPWGNIIAQHNVYAAGAKPFRIVHPIFPDKYLFHAATESPMPELIYRGKSKLLNGVVTINLNDYYEITSGTLEKILKDVQVHVDNNTSWTRVRCVSVTGISFKIESETPCNDEVQWIAIGRRCDAGVSDYKIEANK